MSTTNLWLSSRREGARSILPPLSIGKYAVRRIVSTCSTTGRRLEQRYIATGVWPTDATKADEASLDRVACLTYDADLAERLVHDGEAPT